MNGFKNIINENNLSLDPIHDVIRAPLTKDGGYKAAKDVLATGASAVFAANDEMALLQLMKKGHLKEPQKFQSKNQVLHAEKS